MTNKKSSVGILGAGISGLSAAYALAQEGIAATVYEQQDQVGGAMYSVRQDDWLVEQGPNTLMVKSQELWDLLTELGLDDEIVEANQIAKKRFVVKDGKPTALPMSVANFLTTPLLSIGAKLRLLKEPFVSPSVQHDESVATFIERRLGKQILEYGVNPFVAGIYAGDPKELSVKHTFATLWQMEQEHGSILKGIIKRDRSDSPSKRALLSFKNGAQTLPKALANSLPKKVHYSTNITSVQHQNGHWQVKGVTNADHFATTHDAVLSTIPAHSLPGIVDSQAFNELADLPYAPLSVLALGFKSEQIKHPLDGFGMLIPEVENYKLLGCLFSSTLFPGRAPEGHQLLTCFIGGARHPKLALKSHQELQQIALGELRDLLGIQGDPAFTQHKQWNKAIPQYKVGYDHYLSLAKDIEKKNKGIFLDGNFRGGVSVPDCISSGFETAQKVCTFLKSVAEK